MKSEKANFSIGCTVSSCKYHCKGQDYCTLEKVNIGTHEPHPTKCECIDCNSFEKQL